MTQQIINVGAAPNDGTGDPLQTAFTKSNANFTELYASGSLITPQGRLTLQTATPVMTATQAAKTTLFYTPYCGSQVPIYNGTTVTMTSFAELSNVTTASSVGNAGPAAVAASSIYDLFVWNDAGTVRLTRGPAWTNDTTRSAGTALVRVNGIWLNNATITNGPAAQRGTYVGTIRSNASAQLDWQFGASASLGTPGWFGVWNAYNRVSVASFSHDTTASWGVNATGARPANGSAQTITMRVSAIFGLAEDVIDARYYIAGMQGSPGAFSANIGVGIDSTSAFTGDVPLCQTLAPANGGNSSTQLGFHYWAALEASGGTSCTFYSESGLARSGLGWKAMM